MPKPHLNAGLLAALAVALAACADHSPTTVAPAPPPGREVRTQIECTVAVQEAWARCAEPGAAGAGARSITLGGQGTYVRLQSAHAGYDDDVFSLDVTVQNLLSQPMGTPDGTTVSGVKVFFAAGPETTEGDGEVTVANPDGTGHFTAMGQPYHEYPQILEPRGASAPKTWRFNVPATATRFRFTVYVHTELPAEQGVLRWLRQDGAAFVAHQERTTLYAVWAGGANDVFASGVNQIFHWDGNEWSSFPLETRSNASQIWAMAGSSRRHLFAVGVHGRVWRYDGNRWSEVHGNNNGWQDGGLVSVWAHSDTVVAVGWGRSRGEEFAGQIMVSTDAGVSFARTRSAAPTGTRQLWGVSGTNTANLWAVGVDERPTETGRTRAVVMHSNDAGATWSERIHDDSGHRYHSSVWVEPGRVIVGGGRMGMDQGSWEALLMESRDGGATWTESWFAVPGKSRHVRQVWGTPGGVVHAVGDDGSTFINTGDGWRDVTGTTSASLWGVHGSGSEAWAVGNSGTVVRYSGGSWAPLDLKIAETGTLRSLWGSGAGNVYAVGSAPGLSGAEQSMLLHNAGGGWVRALPSADSTEYADIWGSSASDMYVVGHRLEPGGGASGRIWRYDGSAWSVTPAPLEGADARLTAVWGSGPRDVWVLGHQNGAAGHEIVLLRSTDGGQTWSRSPVGGLPAGEVHVLDAWGSGPGNVYAVGYSTPTGALEPSSLVLRFDGVSWSAATQPDSVRLAGVWGSGAGDVYLVGYHLNSYPPHEGSGIIRHSSDGGATWSTQRVTGPSFADRRLLGVWGTSASDVYAVGAGPIQHFNGTNWQEQSSHGWPVLRAVWGSSSGHVYAVGERSLIVRGTR